MKPHYSISIPKPCRKDWSKMTPNEKGRFCQSCSKTVVDFTKMDTDKIQDYIHNNKNQRICGYIKQNQLDTINLKIPEFVFNQNLNFHRLFLLALLFSMGITLLNCEDEKGKTKKIESIEIVESHQNTIDTIINHNNVKQILLDTINQRKVKTSKTKVIEQQLIEGMMIIETGGIEVKPEEVNDIEPIEIDSIEIEEPPHFPGPEEDDIVFGMIIENSPEFKDTPKNLSRSEKRKFLSDRVSEIVKSNFNQEIADDLGLKGKQKILTQFTISEKGKVTNIKVRAPHPGLEEETLRVLKLLPKFKPAQQRGKNVVSVHSLPIVFLVKD